MDNAYARLPLSFEENRGQADSRVRYLANADGYRVFVTATETVLVLRPSAPAATPAESLPSPGVVTISLVGASPDAPSAGVDELPGKVNYLLGSEPANWHTDLPTYAKVESRDVYPGIDIVHRGNQRQLEYDFVVAPGADPGDITLALGGIEAIRLDSTGDLILATAAGELRQHRPFIYQERAGARDVIAGGYVVTGNEVRFSVGPYDERIPLIIDPVLAYSTYLGGTFNDEGRDISVDANGNTYIAGVTSSSLTFPRGSIPMVTGGLEAFVTKLNAAGDALVYSTFLGHEQSESAEAIAVDSAGHAYVTGYTRSPGFPTTASAYQSMINSGNYSVFLAKLNAGGNGLLYSTFLGGNTASTTGGLVQQEGLGIAVDATGGAYVTGWTNTVNFPQFRGYQTANGGEIDVFLAKLNTDAAGAASLVYSTYLGGGGTERGTSVALDSAGRAHITGRTDSSSATGPFPTRQAIQAALAGGNDAFVAKVDTAASGSSSLIYSTYLGGSREENPNSPWPGGIAVDSQGNAYVTGSTNSWSSAAIPFPTTATAYQPTTVGVGDLDVFLTKLDPAGSTILYSTFFGGTGNDVGFAIAVDGDGHAYLVGETGGLSSADFPIRNAIQPAFGGGGIDAFAAKIDTNGSGDSSLTYSTFFGGVNAELAFGIALDATRNAYLTGKTNSGGLATAGAYQTSVRGSSDAFVAKIEETAVVRLVSLTLTPATVPGSKTSKATIALSNPAPAGGALVALGNSNTAVATVPATTTIAEGQTTRTVTVTTKVVTTNTTADISATYDGVTKIATLTILKPALMSLALSPLSFPGDCGKSAGKVTLTAKAPPGGLTVSLSDTNAATTLPATVTIPAGALSATFTVTATAVSSTQSGTLTATLDGVSRSKVITVRPIGVQVLSLVPNPAVGPETVTATVSLECAAAPGDITVALSSTNPAVAAPTVNTVTVPAGSRTAAFSVTTADVSAVSSATIRAAANGISKSVRLTVNP